VFFARDWYLTVTDESNSPLRGNSNGPRHEPSGVGTETANDRRGRCTEDREANKKHGGLQVPILLKRAGGSPGKPPCVSGSSSQRWQNGRSATTGLANVCPDALPWLAMIFLDTRAIIAELKHWAEAGPRGRGTREPGARARRP